MMTASGKTQGKELTGRSVLMMFVGFFAVVFVANGIFLYTALSTRSGMVANEPYRKGLKYNERIAADQRQSELGWTSDIALSGDDKTGVPKVLAVSLTTSTGVPVTGMAVSGKVGRPATDRDDRDIQFAETAPGRYETAFPENAPGAYIADILIAENQDGGEASIVYRARRRLWLQQ